MKGSVVFDDKMSLEKAIQLGRALSKGGIALSDDKTAFKKRGKK